MCGEQNTPQLTSGVHLQPATLKTGPQKPSQWRHQLPSSVAGMGRQRNGHVLGDQQKNTSLAACKTGSLITRTVRMFHLDSSLNFIYMCLCVYIYILHIYIYIYMNSKD